MPRKGCCLRESPSTDAKMKMAREVTEIFYGAEAAKRAEE